MFKFIWIGAVIIVAIFFILYTVATIIEVTQYHGCKDKIEYYLDEHGVLFSTWVGIIVITVFCSFVDWLGWMIKG